jgi:DUF1365 family protein
MDSCIYEGRVRHTRSKPVTHQFDYRFFMMYLDLDELPVLFEKRWFWSVSRSALARFRRSDHLGPNLFPKPPQKAVMKKTRWADSIAHQPVVLWLLF